MGDINKKQRRQIESLLAERKVKTDAVAEVARLQTRCRELEEHWRLDIDAGNKARKELQESRAQYAQLTARYQELAKLNEETLAAHGRVSRSLEHEKQATAALDTEVATLKAEVAKLNVESLPKTRRRLAERTAEVERLRRELTTANSKVAELEADVSYLKRAERLGKPNVQTQAVLAPQAANNQG
jgi:chromosome segregation ATPase